MDPRNLPSRRDRMLQEAAEKTAKGFQEFAQEAPNPKLSQLEGLLKAKDDLVRKASINPYEEAAKRIAAEQTDETIELATRLAAEKAAKESIDRIPEMADESAEAMLKKVASKAANQSKGKETSALKGVVERGINTLNSKVGTEVGEEVVEKSFKEGAKDIAGKLGSKLASKAAPLAIPGLGLAAGTAMEAFDTEALGEGSDMTPNPVDSRDVKILQALNSGFDEASGGQKQALPFRPAGQEDIQPSRSPAVDGQATEIERLQQQLAQLQAAKNKPTQATPGESAADKLKGLLANDEQGLADARNKDKWMNLLGGLDKSLSKFDSAAASRASKQTQGVVGGDMAPSNLEAQEQGRIDAQNKRIKTYSDLENAVKSGGKFQKVGASLYDVSGNEPILLTSDPVALANLQLRDKVMGLAFDKEGRLVKSTDKRLEQAEELSDTQKEEIKGLNAAQEFLDDMESKKVGVDTGPISAFMERYPKKWTVGEDQDFASLDQFSVDNLVTYIQSKSGKVVTDAERAELERVMPTAGDNDETYNTKLKGMRQLLNKKLSTTLDVLGTEKEGAERYRKFVREEPGSTISNQSTDPKVEEYAKQYKLNYNQAKSILIGRGYTPKEGK